MARHYASAVYGISSSVVGLSVTH